MVSQAYQTYHNHCVFYYALTNSNKDETEI